MSAVLTFVCALAFEICLFTDNPQGVGSMFLRWLTVVKNKLVEIWNAVKRTVVGLWSAVKKGVKAACACVSHNCGCCFSVEEEKVELNSASKIVVVTEHLLLYIKVLYDVWCDKSCT